MAPKAVHVLIFRDGYSVALYGKQDIIDTMKLRILRLERLSWVIWVGTM